MKAALGNAVQWHMPGLVFGRRVDGDGIIDGGVRHGGLKAMAASIMTFRPQDMRLAMALVACEGEAKVMKTY